MNLELVKIGSVAAVIALNFAGASAPAGAQTLMEALAAAYQNNPELLSKRANLQSTDEGVPQALANWRPKVTLSGDWSRSATHLNTRTTTNRDQLRSPHSTDLVVTQPLFRGLRTVAGVRGAENDVMAERAGLIAKEQDILLAAASAYMGVVRDRAVLDLSVNNEQVLLRQLEAARDRFRVGEITRTDVSQAEARLAGSTADRIAAEGALKKARAQYLSVIGEAPVKPAQPGALSGLPKSLEDAVKAASSNHPDVVSADYDLRSANDNIVSVRGELLPSLDMIGTLSRAWQATTDDSQLNTASVKLDLTVPLYQKGSVFSRLRAAKTSAGKSRLDLEVVRRNRIKAATDAWETLEAARARIKSFQAQIDASAIALEGVQREASVGSRTILDVLDAEQELLDAKVNLVRAQRDEIVAGFELKESVGELTANGLKLQVNLYEPTKNYERVRNKLFGGSAGSIPRGQN